MKWKAIALILALSLVLAGCRKGASGEDAGAAYRTDVDPQELVEAVAAELGEDYWADMEIPPEYLESTYSIEADMYEDYYGQIPMMSAHVDSLLVVKSADGETDMVADALNAYRDYLMDDYMQYPDNLIKIQACQVETFGKYVCFVMLGGYMGNTNGEEEKELKACQEANAKALEIIKDALTE